MSRNFELMQMAGRAAEFGPVHAVRDMELPVAEVNGNGHRSGYDFDLDQVTREESLRLMQRVFLAQTVEPVRTVVFAGIDHGNGCSQLCARTAETLAGNVSGSICLVDANFRSPALPEMFGVSNHHGLTDALRRTGPIRSFAKPLREQKLWLLSCGSLAGDSARLLNSDLLQKRFVDLRKEFDYVLIDAPPLTRYSEAIVLGKLADGLVLILEANSTRREVAISMAESLRAAQVRILGAVLNKRTFPIPERLYNFL
jgi:Mrp family chromosome partitioning ATPase